MKSKKIKINAALLALFVAMSCVLGAGCGEDLTFEDGEYTAVLVAQYSFTSSVETDFKIKIKNGELIENNNNYGRMIKGEIAKKEWSANYITYNNFDLKPLQNKRQCLVVSTGDSDCYKLIKYNNKPYLFLTYISDGKGAFLNDEILKIWELVPVV